MGQVYNSKKREERLKSGSSAPDVFRTALYRYGKAAGTARVVPGLAGTRLAQGLANQRNLAYPVARWLGNLDAFFNKHKDPNRSLIKQQFGRTLRIASGSLSGRAIDAVARPFGSFGLGSNLGPLASRAMRIQLGKQLSKRNPIDNAIAKLTNNTSASGKVDGTKTNWAIRKNVDVQKEAQKVLLTAYRNILAMAPDVSSGQYLIGKRGFENKLDTKLMNDVEAWNKMSIAYRNDKGKKEFRDIFGFKQPGLARQFLLNSVNLQNVRATKGTRVDHFFYGEVGIGGDMRGFPWIWAVEYGGDIPVMYPSKRKGKHALNRDKDGNPIYSQKLRDVSDVDKRNKIMKETGQPLDSYIPHNHFIQPTFFVHRAAEKAAMTASKKVMVQQAILTSPASRYYGDWLKGAKRKTAKSKKTGYANKFNNKTSNQQFRRALQFDRGQGARQLNFMDQKIPGPRVEMSHGGFYSKELSDAIGVKQIPEEFAFSFGFRTRQGDSAAVLKKAADVYVRNGGLTSSFNKGVVDKVEKAIRNVPGRSRVSDERNRDDAERYVRLFKNYNTSQGNVKSSHRRAEYLDKVYDFSVKLSPEGRSAKVNLRRKRGTVKADKQRRIEQTKQQKLAKNIFSDLDIQTLLKEIGDF